MVTAVQATRAVGVRSTVSELLEAWFAVAQTGWAPTTIRQTRSVLDRYLHPHLGETRVDGVTPAMIDSAYAQLHRSGGKAGQPLAPGRRRQLSPRPSRRCGRTASTTRPMNTSVN